MSPGARRTRGEAANSRRRRCPEDRNCGTPNIGTRQRECQSLVQVGSGWRLFNRCLTLAPGVLRHEQSLPARGIEARNGLGHRRPSSCAGHSAGASSSPYHSAPAPAVTCTATHQYHLKSSVPSPNKCKRCRMGTARRGPKLYGEAVTIGESGGGNEKVFTRKRGACGDSGTCNGGGHADQGTSSAGGLL